MSKSTKEDLDCVLKELDFEDLNILFTRGTLASAALKGETEMCRILIDHGVNINEQDQYGFTPLHEAAINGHTETVQLLLDSGADRHIKDGYGKKAIDRAIYRGRFDTASVLKEGK